MCFGVRELAPALREASLLARIGRHACSQTVRQAASPVTISFCSSVESGSKLPPMAGV